MYSVDEWNRYGDELRRPLMVAEELGLAKKICVVGAGLSGLTVAYRIASKRRDVSVEIVERTERCGGTIETWSKDGWTCDVAVNATRAHPAFWRLVRDIGLEALFSSSNPLATDRWIYTGGSSSKLTPWMILKKGPFKLFKGVRNSRKGKSSVSEAMPIPMVSDAMTLGIVNDVAANVDADFLMPSMTKFGNNPPVKWGKIKKNMAATYPLFTPKKGSIASFEGGMEVLVDRLVDRLNQLENVHFSMGHELTTPEKIAEERDVPLSSVVWCAPLNRKEHDYTQLRIFAVGYAEEDCKDVPLGYGTLIPDTSCPISGILHESDVHQSSRAPAGFRLFRIMCPTTRSGTNEEIKRSLRSTLCDAEPAMFEEIGTRRIPSYPPGYMASIENNNPDMTRAGWFFSGVSVTHVVAEAERIADVF